MKIGKDARIAIQNGVANKHPITNLEYLGFDQRSVNALECSRFEIITLEDLVARSKDELKSISNFGEVAVEKLIECLANYHFLEEKESQYTCDLAHQQRRLFPNRFKNK